MNTFMHGPSFFSFHFLSFSFLFPQINHFYYFTSRDCRLVEKSHFFASFPMYYSLYNWIGEHDITKLKKIFASKPEKRTQKQAHKDMNEME